MNIPPLKKRLVTAESECDNVWYGYFRELTKLVNDKLNANINGQGGWEDLRFPASAINPAGITGPPSYDQTRVGYSFSAAGTERIDIVAQLPHAWDRSNISPHFHVKGLANSNGNAIFRMEYAWTPSLGVQPAFTMTNTNIVFNNGGGNIILKENIHQSDDLVPPTGALESSIIKFKITRMGALSGDNYDGAVLLDEFDIHYYHAKAGTPQELPTP